MPVLATATTDASGVAGAFDLSIQPPELLSAGPGLSEEERQELAAIADRSFFEVTAGTGAGLSAIVALKGTAVGQLNLKIDVTDPQRARAEVAVTQMVAGEEAHLEQLVRALQRRDRLKIRYESAHALSDGAIFATRPRDLAFTGWEFVDFGALRVDQEKPEVLLETGRRQSLFDWMQHRWPDPDPQQGWLACDDGSMEIGDFIHLGDAHVPPRITLIHVKGAGSASPGRRISVSNYEVVSAQAVKHLRFLDHRRLVDGLSAGLGHNVAALAWHDGQPATRQAMIDALNAIGGSNIERRVVILQPHVRQATLEATRQPGAPAGDLARVQQLDTLLHSDDASCRALGATLTVLSAI